MDKDSMVGKRVEVDTNSLHSAPGVVEEVLPPRKGSWFTRYRVRLDEPTATGRRYVTVAAYSASLQQSTGERVRGAEGQ